MTSATKVSWNSNEPRADDRATRHTRHPDARTTRSKGKVRAGGITVGTLAGAFVVEAQSKDEVTELLRALPAQGIMQWKVTQLESFAHRADIEKKTVQGLRAQK